jgi:23S rRNA pseudouridine1911/1915/1917 synthase
MKYCLVLEVNKPAGVCVYAHRSGGQGRMTVRSALPYVLKPPRRGTMSILRRPAAVHRLDKPTSGLLIVAKTKPAMVELTRQFVERRVKKTYTAIVNGIPDKIVTPKVSSKEAQEMGFDVSAVEDSVIWNLIDHPVDEKSATTLWRSINYARSLVANDDTITMVELKPKTGRFHQLRRHMAWICETPIVGDSEYDENTPNLRERGLFLCANKVSLDHPYFNTQEGRGEWNNKDFDEKFSGGMIQITDDDIVQVRVAIELPRKFSTFFAKEDERGKMIKSII